MKLLYSILFITLILLFFITYAILSYVFVNILKHHDYYLQKKYLKYLNKNKVKKSEIIKMNEKKYNALKYNNNYIILDTSIDRKFSSKILKLNNILTKNNIDLSKTKKVKNINDIDKEQNKIITSNLKIMHLYNNNCINSLIKDLDKEKENISKQITQANYLITIFFSIMSFFIGAGFNSIFQDNNIIINIVIILVIMFGITKLMKPLKSLFFFKSPNFDNLYHILKNIQYDILIKGNLEK